MLLKTERIVELTTSEEVKEAYPIMHQLRPALTEEEYKELLPVMQKEGYILLGLLVENRMAAIAGIALKTNFYCKKHIYVYDLVTDSSQRSSGHGKKLLDYIHDWGRQNGAEYVELESALHRIDAHRFYEEKMNYDKDCYSFRIKL